MTQVKRVATIESQHTQKLSIEFTMIGSYEEMLEWRKPYLDWLANSNIDDYTVSMTTKSRTNFLLFSFKKPRDAVWFKLVWGGNT